MRVEKRGRADVYGIQLEANRTVEQHEKGLDFDKSDIDWNKTRDNIFLIQTGFLSNVFPNDVSNNSFIYWN